MGTKAASDNQVIIGVCSGGACLNKKAKKLRKRLRELIETEGLSNAYRVKKCGCLGCCSDGPVVRVKPGKQRFTGAKPKQAAEILAAIVSAAKD